MNTNGLPIYVVMPETYWDPSMAQMPFVQQPPGAYYQPNQPQYSLVLMAPPTPVSRTYADRSSGFLPSVPLGPGFQDPNISYTSLGFVPQTTHPTPMTHPMIPASFPQPTFAAPFPQQFFPQPFPQQFIPQPVPQPALPPMLVPPRPNHRQRHTSPSVHHHHERHSLPPYVTLF